MVEVRYDATAPLSYRAADWLVVTVDGGRALGHRPGRGKGEEAPDPGLIRRSHAQLARSPGQERGGIGRHLPAGIDERGLRRSSLNALISGDL